MCAKKPSLSLIECVKKLKLTSTSDLINLINWKEVLKSLEDAAIKQRRIVNLGPKKKRGLSLTKGFVHHRQRADRNQ